MLSKNIITKKWDHKSWVWLDETNKCQTSQSTNLPNIHKGFSKFFKFRPITDTNGTSHCLAGKYLAILLYPLTTNEFSLQDSFDAANRTKAIPSYLFENGYQYVSIDAESLFTNVPIKWAVDLILRQIYEECVISTNLKKQTLKKLIIDTFTKTAFLFNNMFYQQKYGVSMGCFLGPVLANIIMTELQGVVIKPLTSDDSIKFFCFF